jgi:site-specific recombinase, phage integrase family
MTKDIKQQLEVDDFNELNHLGIKFYYQDKIEELPDDIKYCLTKGYGRATSDKSKDYWLKICFNLFGLFPYSVHLPGAKKLDKIIDERLSALKFKADTTPRPAVPIDDDLPLEELINIFCPTAPEKKPAHKKKNAKKNPSGNTVEVKGGLIVFGTFIPHYIVSEISNYTEKKEKTKIKPIKPNKNSLNITTIEDLVENYLESVGSKQKFSESTKKEYRLVSKLLQEFLDGESIGINDIDLNVAEKFQYSLLDSKDETRKRGEKRVNKQTYNCVIIDTAKGKCSSESKRVIVLHENIKDLHNYKWVKAIKEQYPTIKSFNKKANGCIRKVISDKKVSDHRLRGNFAKKLVEYDHINNISDSIVSVADELGHNTNKNNRKNLEEYNDLVRGMMGYNLSDALDIYAKSQLLKPKLRDIKAFDEYSGIFKYLDIPSNKIPHIKSNKNNKKDKK